MPHIDPPRPSNQSVHLRRLIKPRKRCPPSISTRPKPKRATRAIALSPPPREVPRPPRTTARGAVPGVVPTMRPPHTPSSHLQEDRQLFRQEPEDEPEPDEQVPPLPSLASPPPPSSLLRNRSSLYKQKSWSPDMSREKVWLRRKGNVSNRQSKSVTDEDLDELKGCIELGFGFDSPEAVDDRLSDTLPALGFYYAVTKQYNGSVPRSVETSISTVSDCDSASPVGSPHAICGPSDDPQAVKTRLRQWAQVVACSVRQSSS